MKICKYIAYIVFSFGMIFFASATNYLLPAYNQTYVTGIEVKRMDRDGAITKVKPIVGETRDVYFINTKIDNDLMVYRNEDTRFSFPFYFKFDSADIEARAQAFSNAKQLVEIKYYGWRNQFIDEFPNVISIRKLDNMADKSHPILTYINNIILLICWIVGFYIIRKRFSQNDPK